MKPLALAAALVVLAVPHSQAQGPVAGPATCPAERAVYELEAEEGASFRVSLVPARTFASIASDLYLRLSTPQRDYWFTFGVSLGYGGTTLLPVSDPYAAEAAEAGPRGLLADSSGSPGAAAQAALLSSLRFLAFDAELDLQAMPPLSGEESPPYILMPEIGAALWYSASALTDDPTAGRDPMPRGMFKRTQCLVAPHPLAFP